jgi:hypothetical protein
MPALAHAGQAEGEISLLVDGGRFPLASPASGELKGTLIVHTARVSATPLARELGVLLHGPAEANLNHESRVAFRLISGRIHHEELELAFPDLTIRSTGSVGLDGTLNVTLEMPVPPRWLGTGKLSAALAKKTIRVPVTGTLDHPRLDHAALRQFNTQFVRELTGDNARQEIEKGLQRLLRPRGN